MALVCAILSALVLASSLAQERDFACLDTFGYAYFEVDINFEAGLSLCEAEGGQLASIVNQREFDFVKALVEKQDSFRATWIGLRRPRESNGTDPLSFSFIDGRELEGDFGTTFGELPWARDRPNNVNNRELCGEIQDIFGDDVTAFNDRNCNETSEVLCRLPCPHSPPLALYTMVGLTSAICMFLALLTEKQQTLKSVIAKQKMIHGGYVEKNWVQSKTEEIARQTADEMRCTKLELQQEDTITRTICT